MFSTRNCALLLFVLCATTVQAVDRSKFKTCAQASFCKRNRADGNYGTDEGKQRYQLQADSLNLDEDSSELVGDLKDTRWPLREPLEVRIQIIQNKVARVRVNEKKPKFARWQVRDVLMDEALKAGPAGLTYNKGSNTVSFTFGAENENELVIGVAPAPFTVELKVAGQPAMRLNSLGLLNFEPYRDPNPRVAPPANAESNTENAESAEVPAEADPNTSAHPFDQEGMWEESFSTHKDTKPRGPADVSMDVSFVGTKHIFGIPEHASSLALKNTNGKDASYQDPFRLYNLDVFEYELDNPMALYGAIPFIMSVDKDKSVGMLWLNTAETFIDVFTNSEGNGSPRKDTHWISESGIIDVFLFVGPKPDDVFYQYGSLTGFGAMPQKFAIAYHQCRWNYNSEEDVAGVDAGFDEHDIPMDVLWLDIEHTNGKKYFTWDSTNFPTPEKMQQGLATKGRKMVTIIDPHIKREGGYHVHNAAQSQGLYVKNHKTKGGDYEGWCWPGSVSYLDFLQPKVRDFWADQFAFDKYQGSTKDLFTWNDMNEPSVFNGPEVTMYKDCLHGGEEEVEHRDVHNIYGFYVQLSSALGQIKREGGSTRPFVLTRSFFAGSQRYGAMWTGDNEAKWDHLVAAAPMLLSLAVSGFSFVGADVGGFFGNPDVELLTRWYQAGAYTPFFRAHAHIDAKRREPWLFGEPHTSNIRKAIRARYAILPYVYTAFHENSVNGAPVIRPLWSSFPENEWTYDIDDQWLFGRDLLVKPVTAPGVSELDVALPGVEPWYDIEDFTLYAPAQRVRVNAPHDKIPVFQRGGSIIPRRERARRSSALMEKDPYTLVIALDSKGTASGQLYDDDGHSFAFRDGSYIWRKFEFADKKLTGSSTGTPGNGKYVNPCTIERIVVLGAGAISAASLTVAGGSATPLTLIQRNNAVIVRKPDVQIVSDFQIVFE